MKFRLSYSYVYGIIAVIKDDLDYVYNKSQNLYIPASQETWRKKVVSGVEDYYLLALLPEAEHSIDVDAIRRALEVIKLLSDGQLEYIKSIEVPPLSESSKYVRKMVLKYVEDISETPFIEKKSNKREPLNIATKDVGGNIPW